MDSSDPHGRAPVAFGPFRFDPEDRILFRDGVEVPLPPRALGVLDLLLERAGKLVPKQVLIDGVWKDAAVTETSLIEAISVVRQALGDDPQKPIYIQTVHRRGYRFVAPLIDPEAARASADPAPEPEPRPEPVAAPDTVDVAELPSPNVEPRLLVPATPIDQPQPASRQRPRPRWVWAAAVAVLVVAALAGLIAVRVTRTSPRVVTRAEIPLAAAVPPGGVSQPTLAISSDGRTLAYVAGDAGTRHLYVRPMDRLDARPIEGAGNAYAPFFSPDGRWVGFFSDGWLRKVSADGGPVRALCAAADPFGASWGADGRIVVALGGSLYTVPEEGGEPRPIGTRASGHVYRWPDMLPGAATVLATRWRSSLDDARIVAIDLETGEERTIVEGATFGRCTPSGHLVFASPRGLMAVSFDRAGLRARGPAVAVVPNPVTDRSTGAAHIAFSGGGTLLYLPDEAPRLPARLMLVTEWFDELSRLVPAV
jgi:serine/threonine-protein kinase